MAETNFEEDMKKGMEIPCPACTEPMNMAAQRCPNCQKDFTKDEVRKNIASKNRNSSFGCLVLCVIGFGVTVMGYNFFTGEKEEELDPSSWQLAKENEFMWMEAAKLVVDEQLRDPETAEYTDMVVYPGSDTTATVICGRVNSRNGFGGKTGAQRFISGGTVMIEEQFTAEQMQTAWDTFCH